MKKLVAALAAVAVSIPALASASNPASAWADVEEVTFEPDAKDVTTATRVIIRGVIARSNMDASFPTYAKPQRGFFYYECPAGKLDLCRLEWKDIAGAVGTTNCAGWGDGAKSPGTINAWCAAKGTADLYPLHMGVQRTPWANGTCDGLKAVASMTCGGDAGVDSGVTTDSGTVSTDTGSPAVEDTGTAAAIDTGTVEATDTGGGAQPAAPAAGSKDGCSVGGVGASSSAPVGLALVVLGLFRVRNRSLTRAAVKVKNA
jgi:hypothetical protein